MRFTIIFFFALIFLGISCTKEHDMMTIEEEPFIPRTNVEVKSLLISIGDDIPFSATINDQVYSSLGGGLLLLKEILLDQRGNSILIESDGYFDEIRYVVPALDAHLYIEVDLTESNSNTGGGFVKNFNGFNAKAGGTISGFKIDINIGPNSLEDAQGNLYEGEANIYFYSLFNTAYISSIRSFPQIHFIEENRDNIFNLYGGLNMVITDDLMNALFVKEDAEIDIEFEAYDMTFDVPDNLELRIYDKENSDWIHIGETVKVEDKWKVTVNNLGIIAWGLPYESRAAEFNLVTDDGIPVPNKYVWLNNGYETPTNLAFSDSEGKIRMHVPLEVDFSLLTVKRDFANPPFVVKEYSNIGSGVETLLNLGDLEVNSEEFQTYKGEVIDCYGDVIEESAIVLEGATGIAGPVLTSYVFSDEDGSYNFAFPSSSDNTIEIKAFDVVSNLVSPSYFVQNDNEEIVDFGKLFVCGEFETFINFNIDSELYAFAFDADIDKIYLDPLYKSTFSANASSENRASFSIEHDGDYFLNVNYEISELAIEFNDGQNSYSFACNSDCKHSMLITGFSANFYEGLIKHTDSGSEEVIIGAFRLPKQ